MILVLATENKDKGKEVASIIGNQPHIQLRLLSDYPGLTLPPEDGRTYQENAMAKARYAAKSTGQWAIGDDSGLEIDALNGAPGLYSARFAGEKVSYADNRNKALDLLCDVSDEKRSARFICTVGIVSPSGDFEASVDGQCEGLIARVGSGDSGFGYDPIFYLPQYGKTFSECSSEEKNQISHRGKATRTAIQLILEKMYGESSLGGGSV
ncbi:MAG: RdgB/HAM1 family non-canonical purine NTP pyrophosphatase [Nitrospirota bacterium]